MNKAKLKSYAPAARRDFIKAVTERANYFGIDAKKIETAEVQGDVAIIAGRPFPKKVMAQRDRLIERVRREGFELTMRKVAYTWFNRFMAIRYMELHNYLDHGFRVLSHPSGSQTPEILEQATHVELAGLDRDKVLELKLDGTKDAELYRMLIVAECNTLHRSMPFLFESIDGPSELLLPDNLLHSDSVIRKLVSEIDEEDWQEIEIIGWLYQFYISDKKDEVIGKVVKSEDIPAATQLFTPNWIVKYMVQNSLGAQWLATYPNSPLKGQMEYYIEPAEQTDEVKAQLAEITPGSLDPEELTLIDPACGSGHILVEAYELFKAIYLERGYRQRDVAKLILEKNLYGLDIDDRAAQMSGFALMMKGRADDRRLFERGVKLNVMALVDSGGRESGQWATLIDQLTELTPNPSSLTPVINELVDLFEHATTFGSLIQVPEGLVEKLPVLKRLSEAGSQDLFVGEALKRLVPIVQQVEFLAAQYDSVVANPPYMGGKGMNALVKKYAKDHFPDAKSDLFACFIERGNKLAKVAGYNTMVTMQSWMFLSSFEKMRERLLREKTICTMAHMSNGVMGIAFGTTATILRNVALAGYISDYSLTSAEDLNSQRVPAEFPVRNTRSRRVSQDEFRKIPGSPVAYWVEDSVREAFNRDKLSEVVESGGRCKTSDDEQYLRKTWEVANDSIGLNSRWCVLYKGGAFQKYYGNREHLIRWDAEAKAYYSRVGGLTKERFWGEPGVTWTIVSSKEITSFRLKCRDGQYNSVSPTVFPLDSNEGDVFYLLALLNSSVGREFLAILNPTLALNVGDVLSFPGVRVNQSRVTANAKLLVDFTRLDWDAFETSLDFQSFPILVQKETSRLCRETLKV